MRVAPPLVARACAAALVVSALVAPGVVQHDAVAASVSTPMMFGAEGTTKPLVVSHESVLGSKLQGLRVFKKWDSKLFGKDQLWARDTGHTLFLSIKAKRNNGTYVKFADIAAAQPGSRLYADMVRQAKEIKSFGDKVYIIFNHEPEAHFSLASGNAWQFKAAWRKIVGVYRAQGVTNAEFVWTMTSWGFIRKDDRNARYYYPGDAYVDHIAADGYNWYKCRESSGKWIEFKEILEGHRQFGRAHPDKGLMVMEWGSTEDPAVPGRKAQWIRNATALFQQAGYEQYKAIMSWEGRHHVAVTDYPCNFDYASSSSAQTAWRDMGRHAAYSGTSVG